MKNYYNILGLSSYEDSQDVILAKYKEITARLRSQVLSKDLKNQLIEVNEAFLVLSDKELKKKYDYSLSSNSQDNTLLLEKPRHFDPVGHVRLTHPDKIRLTL